MHNFSISKGLTSVGKHGRGLRQKGHKDNKKRPSRRVHFKFIFIFIVYKQINKNLNFFFIIIIIAKANWKRRNTVTFLRYR